MSSCAAAEPRTHEKARLRKLSRMPKKLWYTKRVCNYRSVYKKYDKLCCLNDVVSLELLIAAGFLIEGYRAKVPY